MCHLVGVIWRMPGPHGMRTATVHEGLRALIERESARRLALLAGSEPGLEMPRRRVAEG